MAESGRIYPEYTHIEIDEAGVIWLIQNHFESPSVILEMQTSSLGEAIIEDYDAYFDDEDEAYY